MATFAEYPSHTMASNDFTLYPYLEVWNQDQSYLPTSTYADSAYLSPTTFDSYQAQQIFDPLHHQYEFTGHESIHASKNRLHAPSPANSASHSFDYPNPSAQSDSGASVQSTISSAIGSPSAQPQSNEWVHQQGAHLYPGIVQQSDSLFATSTFDLDPIPVTDKGCVDPSLIQPFSPTQYSGTPIPDMQQQNMAYPTLQSPPPMETLSNSPRAQSARAYGPTSPYVRQQSWQPYPQHHGSRRPSISSVQSRHSQHSLSSADDSNKGLCPIPTCQRHVKDLKAHMLTHQNERPEKCPIPTCDYHIKGFARKYDKNRHTLTHYKGTMVCGFCPGSGSAAEKSFNRADVFKRHLTSVHGVEQTPPNARRKSPTTTDKEDYGSGREASGRCSTCGNNFANAQDFYEHLDDCVLRVVQQADPSDAINEKILTEISKDGDVQQTMEKHKLSTNVDLNAPTSFDEDEEIEDDEDADEDDTNDGTYGSRRSKSAARARKGDASRIASSGAITKPTKKGLTHSKNGIPLSGGVMSGRGSKRRKDFPLAWGAQQMRMRKRVVCVYDGPRRLWKDDLMLDAAHDVRIPLPGGNGRYVTDLDVVTMARAEGLHNATEEEKGPWIQDGDVEALMS